MYIIVNQKVLNMDKEFIDESYIIGIWDFDVCLCCY